MSRNPSQQRRAEAKAREKDAAFWRSKRDAEKHQKSRETYQRAVERAERDARKR
jgi:hypothetical protein